jgi:hypothetical protein
MDYTTITVRNTMASTKPAALVFSNGESVEILDGLDGNALRGIARVLNRAAEQADEYNSELYATHGASSFSLSYELEWDGETKKWPSDGFSRTGVETLTPKESSK